MKKIVFAVPLLCVNTFVALPVNAAPDAQILTPIESTLTSSQVDIWDELIQVTEVLKLIAKTCKVGVIINEDVTGTIWLSELTGKLKKESGEETLQEAARIAGLNIERLSDGTYLINKKFEAAKSFATAQNLTNYGFALQVKLDKSKYKRGDNISTMATLSLSNAISNAPNKVLIEGLLPMGNLQPTIIALKNYAQIPLSDSVVNNSYSNLPVILTSSTPITNQFAISQNSIATHNREFGNGTSALSKANLVLREPLLAGRYLYFMTYFSQSLPIYKENTLWSGHLTSNIVEFEVKN